VFLAGDFLNKEAAVQALLDLKANGFTSADLAVFSDAPLEFPHGVLDRPSKMSLAAVSGGITSCLLVIGFVYFAQQNYPIVTGGMPIFSFWATGVVFYELTMLGAIVTTFFWFLRESGLLRRAGRSPALSIEPGVIGLRVQCRPDQVDNVRRSLESTSAANIRSLGDAP
jgi:hypothetical protein